MRSKRVLRALSLVLLQTFLVRELAFAEGLAPLLKDGLEPKPAVSIRFPASTASIEDAWSSSQVSGFSSQEKIFYLIQDAHTNESGQYNLAKALSLILDKEKDLKFVFTEAGVGDNSLSELRKFRTLKEREDIARSYIRKGYLHGAEYLDLTSEKNFMLWGVEDLGLYSKALEDYRQVAKERERFELYLKKIEATVETLKGRLFNPSLATFAKERKEYREERLALTSYFNAMMRECELQNITLSNYPHLGLLKDLKDREEKLDFKKANEEHRKALEALSEEDRAELKALSDSGNKADKVLQGRMEVQAYFLALEEKMEDGRGKKEAKEYPELFKYFEYLKLAKNMEAKKVLIEVDSLEKEILGRILRTEEEKTLLACDDSLFYQRKLFRFTLTPEDYAMYKRLTGDLPIESLTGFLNKQIMDLGTYYERSLFLEEGYEDIVKRAESFYELTKDRDEQFLKASMEKLEKEGSSKAVLITGGFHTANLKSLLRAKGISYISVTPQVWQETNLKKYESVLLGQNFKPTQMPVSVNAATIAALMERTAAREGTPWPGFDVAFRQAGATKPQRTPPQREKTALRGARLAEFQAVPMTDSIRQNFVPSLLPLGIKLKGIEILPIKGDLTAAEIGRLFGDDSMAQFVAGTSSAQAFGSHPFIATDKKTEADNTAVYLGNENIRLFTENNPNEVVLAMSAEGFRDGSKSAVVGNIFYQGREESFSSVYETEKGEKAIRVDIEGLMARLAELRATMKRISMVLQDGLELTNGIVSPDAKEVATNSTSLFGVFVETPTSQFDGKNLFIVPDKARIAGISYEALEDAGVDPMDLPSVALPKIAKARGQDVADYINHIAVFILGARDKKLAKGSEGKHDLIIADARKLKETYPGLIILTPGDGDFQPRFLAKLGFPIVVIDRSGSTEASASMIALINHPNAQGSFTYVSAAQTDTLLVPATAQDYPAEELEMFKAHGVDPSVLKRTRTKKDFTGMEGYLALTGVTGTDAEMYAEVAEWLKRISFNDEEKTAETYTLMSLAGTAFALRAVYETEGKVTHEKLLQTLELAGARLAGASSDLNRLVLKSLFADINGLSVGSTVAALYESGILPYLLSKKGPASMTEVVDVARKRMGGANEGYLHVALAGLEAEGYLLRDIPKPSIKSEKKREYLDKMRFELTDKGRAIVEEISRRGEFYAHFSNFIPVLTRMQEYLFSSKSSGPPFTLKDDSEFEGLLIELEDLSRPRSRDTAVWNQVRPRIVNNLEGMILGPVIVAIRRRLIEAGAVSLDDKSFSILKLHGNTERLLIAFRFLERREYVKLNGSVVSWTEKGKIALSSSKAGAYGVPTSYNQTYDPSILKILLFGSPQELRDLRARNAQSEIEFLVNRDDNIWGSKNAHEIYMKNMRMALLTMFNRPIDDQPQVLGGMGVGTGWFEEFAYRVMMEGENGQGTERSRHLKTHPLVILGADYNKVSLDKARETYAAAKIPYYAILKADISKLDEYRESVNQALFELQKQHPELYPGLVLTSQNVAYETLMLMHNRPYVEADALGLSDEVLETLIQDPTETFVDADGRSIPIVDYVRNLYDHLRGWRDLSPFGLLALELYSVDPKEAAASDGLSIETSYRLTHGYTNQMIARIWRMRATIEAADAHSIPEFQQNSPPDSRLTAVGIDWIVPTGARLAEVPLPTRFTNILKKRLTFESSLFSLRDKMFNPNVRSVDEISSLIMEISSYVQEPPENMEDLDVLIRFLEKDLAKSPGGSIVAVRSLWLANVLSTWRDREELRPTIELFLEFNNNLSVFFSTDRWAFFMEQQERMMFAWKGIADWKNPDNNGARLAGFELTPMPEAERTALIFEKKLNNLLRMAASDKNDESRVTLSLIQSLLEKERSGTEKRLEVYDLRFSSNKPTKYDKSGVVNRVQAVYYKPVGPSVAQGSKKLPVAVIPSFGNGDVYPRMMALFMASQGIAALEVFMPFYGTREPPDLAGMTTIQKFVALGMREGENRVPMDDFFLENQLQGVSDLNKAVEWIQSQSELDAGRVSVMGHSRAGNMAAAVYLTNPAVSSATAIAPVVDYADAFRRAQEFSLLGDVMEGQGLPKKAFDERFGEMNLRRLAESFLAAQKHSSTQRHSSFLVFPIAEDPVAFTTSVWELIWQLRAAGHQIPNGTGMDSGKIHLLGIRPYLDRIFLFVLLLSVIQDLESSIEPLERINKVRTVEILREILRDLKYFVDGARGIELEPLYDRAMTVSRGLLQSRPEEAKIRVELIASLERLKPFFRVSSLLGTEYSYSTVLGADNVNASTTLWGPSAVDASSLREQGKMIYPQFVSRLLGSPDTKGAFGVVGQGAVYMDQKGTFSNVNLTDFLGKEVRVEGKIVKVYQHKTPNKAVVVLETTVLSGDTVLFSGEATLLVSVSEPEWGRLTKFPFPGLPKPTTPRPDEAGRSLLEEFSRATGGLEISSSEDGILVDERVIDSMIEFSNDNNPIHKDAEASLRAGFENRRMLHGMAGQAHVTQTLREEGWFAQARYLSQDISFRKAVYLGDKIRSSAKAVNAFRDEKGRLIVEVDTLVEVWNTTEATPSWKPAIVGRARLEVTGAASAGARLAQADEEDIRKILSEHPLAAGIVVAVVKKTGVNMLIPVFDPTAASPAEQAEELKKLSTTLKASSVKTRLNAAVLGAVYLSGRNHVAEMFFVPEGSNKEPVVGDWYLIVPAGQDASPIEARLNEIFEWKPPSEDVSPDFSVLDARPTSLRALKFWRDYWKLFSLPGNSFWVPNMVLTLLEFSIMGEEHKLKGAAPETTVYFGTVFKVRNISEETSVTGSNSLLIPKDMELDFTDDILRRMRIGPGHAAYQKSVNLTLKNAELDKLTDTVTAVYDVGFGKNFSGPSEIRVITDAQGKVIEASGTTSDEMKIESVFSMTVVELVKNWALTKPEWSAKALQGARLSTKKYEVAAISIEVRDIKGSPSHEAVVSIQLRGSTTILKESFLVSAAQYRAEKGKIDFHENVLLEKIRHKLLSKKEISDRIQRLMPYPSYKHGSGSSGARLANSNDIPRIGVSGVEGKSIEIFYPSEIATVPGEWLDPVSQRPVFAKIVLHPKSLVATDVTIIDRNGKERTVKMGLWNKTFIIRGIAGEEDVSIYWLEPRSEEVGRIRLSLPRNYPFKIHSPENPASGARMAVTRNVEVVKEPVGKIIRIGAPDGSPHAFAYLHVVSREDGHWNMRFIDPNEVGYEEVKMPERRNVVIEGFDIEVLESPADRSNFEVKTPSAYPVTVLDDLQSVKSKEDLLMLMERAEVLLRAEGYPDSDLIEVSRLYSSRPGGLVADNKVQLNSKEVVGSDVISSWNLARVNDILTKVNAEPGRPRYIPALAALFVSDAYDTQGVLQLREPFKQNDLLVHAILHTFSLAAAVWVVDWASEKGLYDKTLATDKGATAFEDLLSRRMNYRSIFNEQAMMDPDIKQYLKDRKMKPSFFWDTWVKGKIEDMAIQVVTGHQYARQEGMGIDLSKLYPYRSNPRPPKQGVPAFSPRHPGWKPASQTPTAPQFDFLNPKDPKAKGARLAEGKVDPSAWIEFLSDPSYKSHHVMTLDGQAVPLQWIRGFEAIPLEESLDYNPVKLTFKGVTNKSNLWKLFSTATASFGENPNLRYELSVIYEDTEAPAGARMATRGSAALGTILSKIEKFADDNPEGRVGLWISRDDEEPAVTWEGEGKDLQPLLDRVKQLASEGTRHFEWSEDGDELVVYSGARLSAVPAKPIPSFSEQLKIIVSDPAFVPRDVKSVLVNDDDFLIAMGYEGPLQDAFGPDVQIVHARNSEIAWGLFQSQKFDLVLTDQNTKSAMTGDQLITNILQTTQPDTRPFVLWISGEKPESLAALAQKGGFEPASAYTAMLGKPANENDLSKLFELLKTQGARLTFFDDRTISKFAANVARLVLRPSQDQRLALQLDDRTLYVLGLRWLEYGKTLELTDARTGKVKVINIYEFQEQDRGVKQAGEISIQDLVAVYRSKESGIAMDMEELLAELPENPVTMNLDPLAFGMDEMGRIKLTHFLLNFAIASRATWAGRVSIRFKSQDTDAIRFAEGVRDELLSKNRALEKVRGRFVTEKVEGATEVNLLPFGSSVEHEEGQRYAYLDTSVEGPMLWPVSYFVALGRVDLDSNKPLDGRFIRATEALAQILISNTTELRQVLQGLVKDLEIIKRYALKPLQPMDFNKTFRILSNMVRALGQAA